MSQPTREDDGPRLNCDAGRRLGCGTFCCRLMVTPRADEAVPGKTPAGTLAKDAGDGWCVHLERTSGRCAIWTERPAVCRGYDCNCDPLLQLVVRDSYSDLLPFHLHDGPPTTARTVRVPYLGDDD